MRDKPGAGCPPLPVPGRGGGARPAPLARSPQGTAGSGRRGPGLLCSHGPGQPPPPVGLGGPPRNAGLPLGFPAELLQNYCYILLFYFSLFFLLFFLLHFNIVSLRF